MPKNKILLESGANKEINTELQAVKKTPAKRYTKGMGQAVADRTINRKVIHKLKQVEILEINLPYHEDLSLNDEVEIYCRNKGYIISHYDNLEQNNDTPRTISIALHIVAKQEMEHWKDVALRVAKGNTSLHSEDSEAEFLNLHHHLRQASLLMSGRHLQHGDETQKTRNMEVFTNCATSAMSFLEFYLLLNGSGVGRAMDDELMLVDYKNLPIVVPVINHSHKDVISGEISERLEKRNAEHMYHNKTINYFEVPDSREGWAKAIEKMEVLAFQKRHRNSVLILDFSNVRPKGSPIGGMQNRPASGPGPLILAIEKIAKLREAAMDPWRAAMFADHYLAECVLVGGARRAARMATKNWRDSTIFDFINLKRGGFLWSSNNSVTVDNEFWNYVRNSSIETNIAKHARRVFQAITEASYYDGTGEPGIINQDKLTQNEAGLNNYLDGEFAESQKYKLDHETLELTKLLAVVTRDMTYQQITNPCVTGDTEILTDDGYKPIIDLVGKVTTIWNGFEWSSVTPKITGYNQEILSISFSDGRNLNCTPYHKFHISTDYDGGSRVVEAKDLEPGMKLIKHDFPIIEHGLELDNAYTQGFVSAEGMEFNRTLYLYKPKEICLSRLEGVKEVKEEIESKRMKIALIEIPFSKNFVPLNYNLKSKLDWLAGLLDGDGTELKEGGAQLWSVNKEFLKKLQTLLSTVGVQSKVLLGKIAESKLMPDGKGGRKEYPCQEIYRICIGSIQMQNLKKLGLKCERLSFDKNPQRDASQFVSIIDVAKNGVAEVVYCFNESKRHLGIFNGVITGQCGEITLNLLGGYCVIADVVPYHAQNDEDACDAFATATKALLRVNLMDSMYSKEVSRTNRIGVGITGFHEWAWKRFGLGWKDIVDEEKSMEMWQMLSRFKRVVAKTAREYAQILGTVTPHTDTTIKPAGTTSKLFGLTEGAHLPSMREFLRWVQFRNDDPIVEEYKKKGYPTKILKTYSGTTVVGFPTQPEICKLGMGDKLVTAAEATPEEQYQYLRLLEKYWIQGVDENGVTPLPESGNQVSYTLKYDPRKVSYEEFVQTLLDGQSSVRCCSVMPQTDSSAYEYQPEEMVTTSIYQQIVMEIEGSDKNLNVEKEDVAFEHIDCGSGACPIDFK